MDGQRRALSLKEGACVPNGLVTGGLAVGKAAVSGGGLVVWEAAEGKGAACGCA